MEKKLPAFMMKGKDKAADGKKPNPFAKKAPPFGKKPPVKKGK